MNGSARAARWTLVAGVVLVAACSSADDRSSPVRSSPLESSPPLDPSVTPVAESAPSTAAVSTRPIVAPASATDAPTTSPVAAPATSVAPKPRYRTEGSDALFDQNVVHTFSIEVDRAKLAYLDEDPTREEYVEASLTFDGERIGAVGMRYKGSIGGFILCTDGPNMADPSGKKTCTKLSIKLKMNWNDKDDLFYGVRRVQLQAMNRDTTLMHERLGYWLYREMGVPAPRATHARVEINGDYVGLFALVEQVDASFARDHFEDGTGNLYKEAWLFDDDRTPRAEKVFVDALETNAKDPAVGFVTGFAAELAAASSPAAAKRIVERSVDVDVWLRTAVVNRAIKHDDSLMRFYCRDQPGCGPHNFYLYEEPTKGKLYWITWDLDNAMDIYTGGFIGTFITVADKFGETRNGCKPFTHGPALQLQVSLACDPLFEVLSTYRSDYDRLRKELVTGPMSAQSITARLAEWSKQIEPAVAEAARLHADAPRVEAWKQEVEKLRLALIASLTDDGR